jgi:hypothetical protein
MKLKEIGINLLLFSSETEISWFVFPKHGTSN